MHPAITQLLDLHQVNVQRQRLIQDRSGREEKRRQADQALAKFTTQHETAHKMVADQGALIRQYTADVDRCDTEIQSLRSRQMEAKSNKEYLECINGIENAKAEKKLREESLSNLNASVDELQSKASAAEQKLAEIRAKYEQFVANLEESQEAEQSAQELERMYQEKRQGLDPKFLEVYERLIEAKHHMPLIPVDPVTRATPLGQIISHNDCERIRGGQLVTDPMTNGILYIKEEPAADDA
ncbi:MAG: hypothetical protein EA401_04495 [Planctomycetota bacterium]|nr:MAG: hypothetical protein EA401_04495 [Planctomycetota bacterium]